MRSWFFMNILSKFIIISLVFLIVSIIWTVPYYGFYTLLRFTITITSIFIALKYKDKHTISLIYWAIAIIFNPLIPVYLDKVIWKIMDFIIACIYLKELKSSINE